MAQSIGIVSLTQKVEKALADLLCQKNEYLCDGKSVEGINCKMQTAYNWWWLIYNGATLTDGEINCIASNLPTVAVELEIGYSVVPITDELPNEETPVEEPIVEPISATITFNKDATVTPTNLGASPGGGSYQYACDGSNTFDYTISGGVAPYVVEFQSALNVNQYNSQLDNSACLPGIVLVDVPSNNQVIAQNTGSMGAKVIMTVTDYVGQVAVVSATGWQYFYNRS